jgi:hypothetical protein
MGPFAVGDGDDCQLDAEVVHALEQASGAEDLVVRVRCDDDKAMGQRYAQRRQGPKALWFEPGVLVGPGMHLVDN